MINAMDLSRVVDIDIGDKGHGIEIVSQLIEFLVSKVSVVDFLLLKVLLMVEVLIIY